MEPNRNEPDQVHKHIALVQFVLIDVRPAVLDAICQIRYTTDLKATNSEYLLRLESAGRQYKRPGATFAFLLGYFKDVASVDPARDLWISPLSPFDTGTLPASVQVRRRGAAGLLVGLDSEPFSVSELAIDSEAERQPDI